MMLRPQPPGRHDLSSTAVGLWTWREFNMQFRLCAAQGGATRPDACCRVGLICIDGRSDIHA